MLKDPFPINAVDALSITRIEDFVDHLPLKTQALKEQTLAVFDEHGLLLHSLSKMEPAQVYDWLTAPPHNMKTGAAVSCCRLLIAMAKFSHPFVDASGSQI